MICLEGPSAVGKTTLARHLEERFGFPRVAEVNELFAGATRDGPTWYFDRQVERHGFAAAAIQRARSTVLDGDPFQPLWYNWIYPEFGPVTDAVHYYSKAIIGGHIAFPDCYVVLAAPREALRARKDGDRTRRRGNFERHLKMIEAQRRYFTALRDHAGVAVHFIDNIQTAATAARIADLPRAAGPKSTAALQIIADWLAAQPAAEFA